MWKGCSRADGLGARGAPGLLDGSATEPGGRGPPAAVPRARGAGDGTADPAHQPDQGPARGRGFDFDPLRPKHRERLEELRTGDGRPLPPCLLAEIRRQLGRLDAVVRDLATVEAERNGLVGVRSTDRSAPRAAEAVEPGGIAGGGRHPGSAGGPAVAPEEATPGAASEMAPAGRWCGVETAPAEPALLMNSRAWAGVRRRALARRSSATGNGADRGYAGLRQFLAEQR